jgi:hypothetical protein
MAVADAGKSSGAPASTDFKKPLSSPPVRISTTAYTSNNNLHSWLPAQAVRRLQIVIVVLCRSHQQTQEERTTSSPLAPFPPARLVFLGFWV